MLRANVGLSRKLSHNYQSTGYAVNIDGEIPFQPNDAEGVLEKIRELFDLAHEALNQQVERDHSDTNFPPAKEFPLAPKRLDGLPVDRGIKPKPQTPPPPPLEVEMVPPNREKQKKVNSEPATNKQVQFILNIGRRHRLTTPQLEHKVAQIIGRKCGLYDITKKEAGLVLDELTHVTPAL